MDDPAVQRMALKYEKDAAGILLRWSLQKGCGSLWKPVDKLTNARNFLASSLLCDALVQNISRAIWKCSISVCRTRKCANWMRSKPAIRRRATPMVRTDCLIVHDTELVLSEMPCVRISI